LINFGMEITPAGASVTSRFSFNRRVQTAIEKGG
jgi:hypothetical protein